MKHKHFLPFRSNTILSIVVFMLFSNLTFSFSTSKSINFNSIIMAELKGEIVNENGVPQEFIAVTLHKASDSTLIKGAITNSMGAYHFQNLEPGKYFLKASALGYNEAFSDIIMLESEVVNVFPLIITTSTTSLDEIVLTANTAVVTKESDRFVIKMKGSALAAGTSIDLLKATPFVFVSGSNQVSLQGKTTLVLVDNKQIPDTSVESILQMIPAGNILSIELITSPSAKYDAIYGAVINIITKKGAADGYTGNIRINGAQGEYGGVSVNSSLTYKKGNLTSFGTIGYLKNDQSSFNSTERTINSSSTTNVIQEEITRLFFQKFYSVQAGLELELNDNQKIGILITTNPVRRTGSFNSSNKFNILNGPIDSILITKSPFKSSGATSNYNMNYNLLADSSKTELSVLGTYTRFRSDLNQLFPSSVVNENGEIIREPTTFRNNNASDIDIWITQADFSRKFKKEWKFETGLKYQITNSTTNIIYEEENVDDTFIIVPEFSNNIKLKERIFAAYGILSKNWKKDKIQLGLRFENTDASFTGGIPQNSSKIFPTLFYQHDINDKYNLSLSYKKTISRASYSELVPYTIFANAFTVFTGNPSLRPQFDDTFSLDVNLNKLNISFNYITTKGMFGQFPSQQDFESGVTHFSWQNLDTSNDFIVYAFYPLKITSWWQTRNSGTLFGYSKSKGKVLNEEFSLSSSWFNFRSNQTFTFSKKVKMELVADYSSALTSELTRIGAVGNVSTTFLIKILKNKGSLRLGISEILGRNKYTSDQFFSNYSSEKFRYRDSRRFRVGFTYNFGKLSSKTPSKKLGNRDAINRIQ